MPIAFTVAATEAEWQAGTALAQEIAALAEKRGVGMRVLCAACAILGETIADEALSDGGSSRPELSVLSGSQT